METGRWKPFQTWNLVGGFKHLKNISQWGGWSHILNIMESKKCLKPPTSIQLCNQPTTSTNEGNLGGQTCSNREHCCFNLEELFVQHVSTYFRGWDYKLLSLHGYKSDGFADSGSLYGIPHGGWNIRNAKIAFIKSTPCIVKKQERQQKTTRKLTYWVNFNNSRTWKGRLG